MTAAPRDLGRRHRLVALGGMTVALDPSGALYWPEADTLVISDLHLEKGSSYARRGTFLPPYDSAITLAQLARVMARFAPGRVIALGDSFHDPMAAERLGAEERAALAGLIAGRDWIWVTGNHDPAPPTDWGGRVTESLEIAGVTFRHEPSEGGHAPEVAGHLHPVARVAGRGRALRCRCFVGCETRAVLPAFGAFTGGLDIRDPAFARLWPSPSRVRTYALGRNQVYAIGSGSRGMSFDAAHSRESGNP
ncbi:ligase-associated DNA damage response endonuclease PdeM [Amorphus sp. 3PC139-8]|uniref:ligase-associated DNA damage response endonuclease PdeM n=1 Tax=Amorphus sp. 3PC139-8 TaxID=2735676 RepID=UPI00345C6BA8